MVRLTDEGLAAVEAAAPGHAETVRRMFFDQLRPGEGELLKAYAERVIAAARAQGC
jgi:hypothetical protein